MNDLTPDQYFDQLAEELHQCVEHQRSVANIRALLFETIRVLEETRRSFKCKCLEELRRKLLESLEGNSKH